MKHPKTHVLRTKPAVVNFSGPSFHILATHYYKCVQDFQPPNQNKFSPVHYALLCRAIELELKSRLLNSMQTPNQTAMKALGHDLKKAYMKLPSGQQVLTPYEFALLRKASKIYNGKKGFDYIQAPVAVKGYSDWPDLKELDELAKKLLG
jgi:hypothetical protein